MHLEKKILFTTCLIACNFGNYAKKNFKVLFNAANSTALHRISQYIYISFKSKKISEAENHEMFYHRKNSTQINVTFL